MKKVISIILTMFIAFAVTNCSEDVTGVATGVGETGGGGGTGPGGGGGGTETKEALNTDMGLKITGELSQSITIITDFDDNITMNNGNVEFSSGTSFKIVPMPAGYTYTLTSTGNDLSLTVDGMTIEGSIQSFDADNGTLTINANNAGIYTISMGDNYMLTITEPGGGTVEGYYIERFNDNANIVILRNREKGEQNYVLKLTEDVLNTSSSTGTTLAQYIDSKSRIVARQTYTVKVENNGTLDIREADNYYALLADDYYIENFDESTNTVTISPLNDTAGEYTAESTEADILTIKDANRGELITGYIEKLQTDPDVLTVTAGDTTIVITDSTNSLIEPSSSLTISYADGLYILDKSKENRNTIVAINPENGGNYKCPNASFTPIITAEALQSIEPNGKDYCLGRDITLTGNFEPIGYPDTDITVHNYNGNNGKRFSGTLDGNNNTIRGLNINKADAYYIGLFAFIGGEGRVRNLVIENPLVKGYHRVGVVTGVNEGGVYNVRVEGSGTTIVEGKENVGGIVGDNRNFIGDSHVQGNVSGTGGIHVGGLVGWNLGGTISYSSVEGDVSSTSTYTGGLVGQSSGGEIEHSHTAGTVKGTGSLGGLVGQASKVTIRNSYAEGSVTGEIGSLYVGGLVGWSENTNMEGSYATGAVFGTRYTGGLVGYSYVSNIKKSYATGSVIGTGRVGGLVGYNYAYDYIDNKVATVENSFSTGSVNGTDRVGGLVGYNYMYNSSAAVIRNCYATGSVIGTDRVGGLVGHNYATTNNNPIENSYFDITTTEQTEGVGSGKGSVTGYSYNSTSGTVQNNATTPLAITAIDFDADGYSNTTDDAWDFTTIWTMLDGQWPTLQWQTATTP